jgi:hypothetical protein
MSTTKAKPVPPVENNDGNDVAQRFEYQVCVVTFGDVQATLNTHAASGWEVVSITSGGFFGGRWVAQAISIFFRRRKAQPRT